MYPLKSSLWILGALWAKVLPHSHPILWFLTSTPAPTHPPTNTKHPHRWAEHTAAALKHREPREEHSLFSLSFSMRQWGSSLPHRMEHLHFHAGEHKWSGWRVGRTGLAMEPVNEQLDGPLPQKLLENWVGGICLAMETSYIDAKSQKGPGNKPLFLMNLEFPLRI